MKINKERFFDFLYTNSNKINVGMFIGNFLIIFFKTSFFNSFATIAFQLFFTGMLSNTLFRKYGLEFIQFERYRDDIGVVQERRTVLFTISLAASTVLCLVIFLAIDIKRFIH